VAPAVASARDIVAAESRWMNSSIEAGVGDVVDVKSFGGAP
jgi:hypothetical protein